MHLYVILTKCISSMPFYSTKMYLSTSSTASVYVFFYAILFYEDLFLNFPNRQFIYSMLFYFTKIYFQLASSGFLLCHIYKDIFSTFSAGNVFLLCYSIHEGIFGTAMLDKQGFATLDRIGHATGSTGLREFRDNRMWKTRELVVLRHFDEIITTKEMRIRWKSTYNKWEVGGWNVRKELRCSSSFPSCLGNGNYA